VDTYLSRRWRYYRPTGTVAGIREAETETIVATVNISCHAILAISTPSQRPEGRAIVALAVRPGARAGRTRTV
jgi:hypothetical protein